MLILPIQLVFILVPIRTFVPVNLVRLPVYELSQELGTNTLTGTLSLLYNYVTLLYTVNDIIKF